MEEKRYLQAVETLRDSLNLMNCAMKERQAQRRVAMDTDDLAISHAAATKLVEHEGVTSCLSQTTSNSRGNDMGRAAPLETSSATLTLPSPVSISNAHPVRIIQFTKSSKSVVEVEFLTSIILFNYAVSRSSLGSIMSDEDKRKEGATSLRLFEMAWALLSSLNSIQRDLHAAEPALVMAKDILNQIIALRKQGYARNSRNNNMHNINHSIILQGLEGDNTMGYYQLLHSTCHTLVMARCVRDIENVAPAAAA